MFARLLERVLPMQVNLNDQTKRVYTPEEATQRLRSVVCPAPSLLELPTNLRDAIDDPMISTRNARWTPCTLGVSTTPLA